MFVLPLFLEIIKIIIVLILEFICCLFPASLQHFYYHWNSWLKEFTYYSQKEHIRNIFSKLDKHVWSCFRNEIDLTVTYFQFPINQGRHRQVASNIDSNRPKGNQKDPLYCRLLRLGKEEKKRREKSGCLCCMWSAVLVRDWEDRRRKPGPLPTASTGRSNRLWSATRRPSRNRKPMLANERASCPPTAAASANRTGPIWPNWRSAKAGWTTRSNGCEPRGWTSAIWTARSSCCTATTTSRMRPRSSWAGWPNWRASPSKASTSNTTYRWPIETDTLYSSATPQYIAHSNSSSFFFSSAIARKKRVWPTKTRRNSTEFGLKKNRRNLENWA